MNRFTQTVALIGFGVLLGALGTNRITAQAVQQVSRVTPQQIGDPNRFVTTAVKIGAGSVSFLIRDTRSAGCWLMVRDGDAATLAPAPELACSAK